MGTIGLGHAQRGRTVATTLPLAAQGSAVRKYLPRLPPPRHPQPPPLPRPGARLPARQAVVSIHLSSCPALSSPRAVACAGWMAWLMSTSPDARCSMARARVQCLWPRRPAVPALPAPPSSKGRWRCLPGPRTSDPPAAGRWGLQVRGPSVSPPGLSRVGESQRYRVSGEVREVRGVGAPG